MKKIVDIFKGALMGIANVIPGLSGGTIAVAIGIYEKLINAIADLLKHPIKALKEVWPIIVGIILGIVFSVVGISYMLENYEVPSTMLFVGFILGSLPIVIKEVENKKVKKRHITAFTVMLAFVILIPLLSVLGIQAVDSELNPILLFFIGVIAAATMIIPGVSGSMVLMTMGYYDNVMLTIRSFLEALKSMDMSKMGESMVLLVPFGIGVVVGIFVMAKIMKMLLKKYKDTVNWAILGLIVASPFAIITKINIASAGFVQIIISVLTFALGYGLAYYVCKLDEKIGKKEGK